MQLLINPWYLSIFIKSTDQKIPKYLIVFYSENVTKFGESELLLKTETNHLL